MTDELNRLNFPRIFALAKMKHLNKLFQDIKARCVYSTKQAHSNDLQLRLFGLSEPEKHLIAGLIYDMEYDIGTGHLLELLAKLKIISVQYYVAKVIDSELTFNICNDFLENFPFLFALIVKGATQNEKLRCILDSFLQDFVEINNNISEHRSNPFHLVLMQLTSDEKYFLHRIILRSILKKGSITIEKALSEQHLWKNDEIDAFNIAIIQDCLVEKDDIILFIHHHVLMSKKHEINWKSYCRIIDTLGKMYRSSITSTYRKLLIADFKTFVKEKNDFLLYLIMITIRQLSFSAPEYFKYNEWFKQNIGEMMYIIGKEEFQYVMRVLVRMTEHEGNKDFINIHIKTRIQAPPLCNDLVYTFKAILTSRLESFGKELHIISLDD